MRPKRILIILITLCIAHLCASPARSQEDARSITDSVLAQLSKAATGAERFKIINAAVDSLKKCREETRIEALSLFIKTMNDKNRVTSVRWPCVYIVIRSGEPLGIPDVIEILLHDSTVTMRGVSAEALGGLKDNAEARGALMKAARSETNLWVRKIIAKYLGDSMPELDLAPQSSKPAVVCARELAPSGPPMPPPGPPSPVEEPLPWPFPGDHISQNIFNNYQTMTDSYIHCGLDFIHPAGTPVTAVESGYVSAIWTSPTHTHDFFIITQDRDGDTGWSYTHMDHTTFTFKKGNYVNQGQVLGRLVKFTPGSAYSMDHLHLDYVRFTENRNGQFNLHRLIDPLYCFDWKDIVPPVFLPLRFVEEGTIAQIEPDADGITTVQGRIDILAAITDSAYPGQNSYLGVPVVMLSISDGTHTMQKLVVDHRGDVGNAKYVQPLYLSRKESKKLTNPSSFFPYYQVLRVTKTDGDGLITPEDSHECWDTTAKDGNGNPLWPDGEYSVNVYAWDIAGNQAVVGAMVRVKNNR